MKNRNLATVEAEESDVEARKKALVHHFEDRTTEFVRDVKPLLDAARYGPEQRDELLAKIAAAKKD